MVRKFVNICRNTETLQARRAFSETTLQASLTTEESCLLEPCRGINESQMLKKPASGNKGGLASHESSSVHKRAVEVIETLPRTTRDIGEQLSSAHAEEKLRNRVYLLKVFQTIQFLTRQGLALRGDQND